MKKRSLLLTSLFIGSVAFCTLSSSSAYAIAQESTLTMSISSSDLSINIAPGVNGSFAKSSTSTIGINTDNFTGYTLSIATLNPGSGSSVPSTSLSDINDNEIESISSSISEATFSSSSTYNNKWGYRPSQYIATDTVNNTMTTISDNTDFLPAPTTEGDLLDITDVPNANNNTYTLDFGARVDYSLASGAYSRTMVVMAVANDIVYNINYDENTDDVSVANMPSINPQPITMPGQTPTVDSTASLSSDVPTRTGYNFTGWCDTATTIDTTTGGQTCSGTSYNAEGTYGIDQTIDGTNIRLFATWATNEYDITFKTSAGISQIDVKQDSTTKCTIVNNASNNTTGSVCRLNYTIPYTIEATVATGYSFNTWTNSTANGTITDASLTSTTFTTGTNTTTITPTATPDTYTITLNANGGTLGSTTATATYDSTTLSTITNPTRANSTGTRTISGFTLPSGNNADGATITWPSSGCTSSSNCSSTNTTTYTFNGWYKETGATNKIASNASTPVLQTNTSYTDANGKWTSTSNQTLYAGWTNNIGSYSSVTLPSITKTGYTCGWSTNQSATDPTYTTGASIVPSGDITLYGICTPINYTQTTEVRYENADGTWGNYTLVDTQSIAYGSSYSWSTSDLSGFDSTSYQSASVASYTVTDTHNNQVSIYRKTFTLTVTAGTNTSNPTGGGTKRWGESVAVGVTKASNVTCTSYATPTWTATAGTAPSAGTSTTYTMPKSNATVTATSSASNVAQTVTLSKGTGVSSIKIGSTNYSGTSVSLNCGTYNISGNYNSGYEFSSWARANNVTVASTSSASTTMTVSGAGTLTLNGKKAKIYMQNVATWGSTLNTGNEITVTDARDGKEYTVAKLADGNIWMTQNLDHDIKTDGTVTYDSTTTDISSAWSPSTATYATSNTTWNRSNTAPESYDPGDLCWNGTIRSDYGGTISTDTTTCGNDKHYHIGNYYNWTAAVAMNDSSGYTTQNTDVNQSICPAGWRLPISGTSNTGSKSFQYLVNQLSLTSGKSSNIQNSPVYFVYGGYWTGSSNYVGNSGHYRSSVVYDDLAAYDLYFYRSGNFSSQGVVYRYLGHSVRCVAR